MKMEQNAISRDWAAVREGRRFMVNFTESDGQILALCNRDNWEVLEETEDGCEELCDYVFSDSTPKEGKRVENKTRLKEKLVRFCIDHWDNEFGHAVWSELGG
jgi:hypothetical protein